jgi:multidrug efflux pump subunit AcrB
VAGKDGGEYPAVTIAVTKKPGENAIDVANAVMRRVQMLRNTVVPHDIEVAETRNYGATANDKAQMLIQKLLFATASVVALVFLALGRREAAIVGSAVILTLAATLFASWAWGFTLNRVSLFALIFSIGILVDDAIVVVEKHHRHQQLSPGKPLVEIIPGAVDEVGGPTILATLTVIAALLPMAFVSGLMGPYMSPIPINASMGMLISLAIAFVVTPWLSRLWLKAPHAASRKRKPHGLGQAGPSVRSHFPAAARRHPRQAQPSPAGIGRRGADRRITRAAGSRPGAAQDAAVRQQIRVPGRRRHAGRHAGRANGGRAPRARQPPGTLPEVTDYQAYAGIGAPINFNGLVRQYYLRAGGEVGDIQVNLVDKHRRSEQSHAIAMRVRPALQQIGRRFNANVKVVEVPPGPPVQAPIVAEVYGPEAQGRRDVAKAVRAVFDKAEGVVDVDDSSIACSAEDAPARRPPQGGDARRAAGSHRRDVANRLAGEATSYLHDETKYPAAATLQLPAEQQGNLDLLLQLSVRSASWQAGPDSRTGHRHRLACASSRSTTRTCCQ